MPELTKEAITAATPDRLNTLVAIHVMGFSEVAETPVNPRIWKRPGGGPVYEAALWYPAGDMTQAMAALRLAASEHGWNWSLHNIKSSERCNLWRQTREGEETVAFASSEAPLLSEAICRALLAALAAKEKP